MWRGVLFALCVGFVAARPYEWENAGNPFPLTHHCLCRFLVTSVTVEDVVLTNNLRRNCPARCADEAADVMVRYQRTRDDEEPADFAMLCAVYTKKRDGDWVNDNVQQSAQCSYAVPPDVSLNNWKAVTDAAVVAGQKKIINFFWWGNPTSAKHKASAFSGVNTVSQLLAGKGYTINYYYQQTAAVIRDQDMPGVNKIPIGPESAITSLGNILSTTDLAGQEETVNNILGTYQTYGAKTYASLKDLAMHLILYRNGGYFFDASLTSTATAAELDEALDSFPTGNFPRYPLVDPLKQTIFVRWTTDGPVQHEHRFYHLEFNGAWAPQNHPATKTTVLHFISLCHTLRLDTGGRSTDDAIHNVWSSAEERNLGIFKEDAGNLVQSSVLRGLVEYAHSAPIAPQRLVFASNLNNVAKTITFVPLKLVKHYGNLYKEHDLERMINRLEQDLSDWL